ncbi:MAG: CRTAC1 family protein [Gemmataceae bacterium]
MMRSWPLLLACLALAGCQTRPRPVVVEPTGLPWFNDATQAWGIDFVHDPGPLDNKFFMPQSIGSGAALFDFDGDDRLDVLLLNNGGPRGATNRLFRQKADGTFQDVSAGSGLDFSGHCMGAAVGDVNNDGRPDVLITLYGSVRLLLQESPGKFRDATAQAGLDNPAWGTSACFLDYDRDGWLDLVVVNYVDYDPRIECRGPGRPPDFCHPLSFPGTVSRLFRNRGVGPDGAWRGMEDVTVASGLVKLPGTGLGVTTMDFNGDGWPDILVANDAIPNRLWINQKNGTFLDEAMERGLAVNVLGQAQGNMGIAIGDTRGIGLFDVFITHLTQETHTLWRQGPRGFYRDETAATGLLTSRGRGTGFGTVLGDFNHDGRLDLAIVNGRVMRGTPAEGEHLAPFWRPYAESNQLYSGEEGGRFQNISAANAPFCGQAWVSRALVGGDIDGDGAIDLLVTRVGESARLYRNVAPDRGRWLLVRAVDPALRRDAYGAEIRLRTGSKTWLGWVNPGQSYLASNDPRVHVGLGSLTTYDAIEVLWPNGDRELFPGGETNRQVTLRKGQGKKAGP